MAWFVILLVTIWAICSIISYGVFFAYFQSQFPRISRHYERSDQRLAMAVALLGPIALIVGIGMGLFRHGYKWHRVNHTNLKE